MKRFTLCLMLALVASMLPINAQQRQNIREGESIVDPKYPNIKRQLIDEDTDEWKVIIEGKLPSSGVIDGHEYVDLGLQVKWATNNIGANMPYERGNYYAWAEVVTKSKYEVANSISYGKPIYRSTILGNPKYDAARKNWGGKWRLPKTDEAYWLIRKCKWEYAEMNGQLGFLLTSIKNGNMLFIPSLYDDDATGYIWTSDECDMDDKEQACSLFYTTGHGGIKIWSESRASGLPIRPVIE